jgi:hypothetical protein
MKKLLTGLIMSLLMAAHAFGQSFTLTGFITDSARMPLAGVTVVMLRASDSVLTSFASTNSSGGFTLRRIPAGEYRLQASLVGYQKHTSLLTTPEPGTIWMLDTIRMGNANFTLGEVTIEADQSPIVVKKDTLEYNAASFGAQANEVVEDLLKKLPGIEVDSDGGIKAQGETVNKVFVDGKEFFGTDPKMATRNLPADAINKVQVIDRKSDAAQFTGIDDGEREKAINLTLKEDRKKGLFGNASAGYGTENRATGKISLNRFRPGVQLSVIGAANNVNQQGFSFEDYFNFMGGMGGMGRGGIIRIETDSDDGSLPIGNSLANGFVNSGNGGLNFSKEFSKKLEWNGSYLFAGVQRITDQSTFREQFNGENSFTSLDTTAQVTRSFNHTFNSRLEYKPDSQQQIVFNTRLRWNESASESVSSRYVLDAEGNTQNENQRTTDQTGQRGDAELSLNYNRKFSKAGRNLQLRLSGNGQFSDQLTNYDAFNYFFLPQGPMQGDTIVQEQGLESSQLSYNLRTSYTEPLGNKQYLTASLRYQNFLDASDQRVFDLYPARRENFALANTYNRDYQLARGGLRYMLSREKLNVQANVDVQNARLQGELVSLGDTVLRNFAAVLPGFDFTYRFSNSKSIDFEYRTEVNAPTVQQLQPALDNRDPLNLYLGNPDLQFEYVHNAEVRAMIFDPFSSVSFFAFVQGGYTLNKITNALTVDSLFRQITTPVNVDRDVEVNAFANFSAPIKPLKIRVSVNGNLFYNNGFAFVNSVENVVNRMTASGELRIDNNKKGKQDLWAGANLSYNQARYSETSLSDRTFLNKRFFGGFRLNAGDKWSFRSELNWNIYGGATFEDDQSVPLLSAGITRFFLQKRLSAEISGFDLLNQNFGVSRTAGINYVEEVQTLSLARYFMFTLTYNLSRNAGGPPPGPRFMIGG